jgi:hypothetical protein
VPYAPKGGGSVAKELNAQKPRKPREKLDPIAMRRRMLLRIRGNFQRGNPVRAAGPRRADRETDRTYAVRLPEPVLFR